MTEPVAEPRPPQTTHEPVSPDKPDERGNTLFGLALFGIVVALAVGALVVMLVYLALD